MDFLRSLFCKKTEPIKVTSDSEQKLLENKEKNTVDVVKQNPINNENEELALLSEGTDDAKKAQEEAEAAKKAQEEAEAAVKKTQEESEAAAKNAQEEAEAVE